MTESRPKTTDFRGKVNEPRSVLWRTLTSDRYVQAMAALFLVAAALYLLNDAGVLAFTVGGGMAYFSRALGPFLFNSLAVAALGSSLHLVRSEERRFWRDVTAAFVAWQLVTFLYLFFPTPERPLALGLVVEALYLAFYVALILAIERHPHRVYRWRPTGLERALAWPAVSLFALGLFGYFFVVPTYGGSAVVERWSPSYLLYLILDTYLTARLLSLARFATTNRWRLIYLLLGLSVGSVLLNDLIELRLFASGLLAWGSSFDLVFYSPYLWIVLARCRAFPMAEEAGSPLLDERPEVHFTRPSGRTMSHALLFPLVHFVSYRSGLFGAATRETHETLVFVAVLLLGTVAMIQHRLLERKARELWLDRERVEEALRASGQDLRLMVERYHADQKLRLSQEKFAKAFRVSPDVMAITSLTDGRLTDVNDAFERATGHSRQDALGRTVSELGLWGNPEEREKMVATMQRRGTVRDLRGTMRTKAGELVPVAFWAEKLVIEGEPYLLSVTRILSEAARGEESKP